ncbi:hypothetical protein CQA62_01545 [Helicobacter cholecystus]|uniref:Uncharacterized protein n=1 Tax=Helicobacter cholecystus TaxID=45498 RepID=A0A3D8IYU5_9HELI|nr:hypothetical protein [Helicobacter cholecystus]RDU70120.1 hypothetical protein CQA62_01545 [Helicobacter cholecystus]VEJ24702.1 Uncharacterised protein [Helicobacter cholecystus]
MQYIDSNGVVWEREEILEEIESLLNRIDDKHPSILSKEMMREVDMKTLGSIYEGLFQKSGKEIINNQEWLFGLVDN